MFVIWEPVLATDWGTPSLSLPGNVSDGRASHFWDREHLLSANYGGAPKLETLASIRKIGFRMEDVVWDVALVYPPGAKWGSSARLLVAPVMKFRDDLAATMAQTQ